MTSSKTFAALVLTSEGKVQRRAIAAPSVAQARQTAAGEGETVLSYAAESAPERLWRWRPVAFLDTLAFAQDLATLIQAGVPVWDALEALAQRTDSAQRMATLRDVADGVSAGLCLSAALRHAKAFPELLVATVGASEQTGHLEQGLLRYARHQRSLRAVRDRVVAASVYPALLVAVGGAVLALLLGFVIPRFARLLDRSSQELPLLSRALLAWGRAADAHPVVLVEVGLVVLTGFAVVGFQLRNPTTRRQLASLLPGIAKLARQFQLLQMYRTSAILASGGMPLIKALQLSAGVLNPADQLQLAGAIQKIAEGYALSDALTITGLADPLASSMLAVAERSGALAPMLDRIADAHERHFEHRVEILTRLVEPILMIIFGVLIGGIVLLMYLPIFDLAASVT